MIPQHPHGLGLHNDEVLPREYTPALARLLALLSGRYRGDLDIQKKITVFARRLYFAPAYALDIVTDELTDYPPPGIIWASQVQEQVLAIMKTVTELEMLLQSRKKRPLEKTPKRATNRRRRLTD